MCMCDTRLTGALTAVCAFTAKVRAHAGIASGGARVRVPGLVTRPAHAGESMTGQRSGRPTATRIARNLSSISWWLVAGALLVVVAPSPVSAQMGMLKKLKKAVSAPDSSARAKDSLAQIAAGVLPESVK